MQQTCIPAPLGLSLGLRIVMLECWSTISAFQIDESSLAVGLDPPSALTAGIINGRIVGWPATSIGSNKSHFVCVGSIEISWRGDGGIRKALIMLASPDACNSRIWSHCRGPASRVPRVGAVMRQSASDAGSVICVCFSILAFVSASLRLAAFKIVPLT